MNPREQLHEALLEALRHAGAHVGGIEDDFAALRDLADMYAHHPQCRIEQIEAGGD
jgi:hypothetical protein